LIHGKPVPTKEAHEKFPEFFEGNESFREDFGQCCVFPVKEKMYSDDFCGQWKGRETPLDENLPWFTPRVKKVIRLAFSPYTPSSLEGIAMVSETSFRQYNGCGDKAINQIRRVLEAHGMELKP
jgi:hypothetical protein